MNTRIKSTNVSMSQALSEHVDKNLEKITKLLKSDPAVICDVELARTTGHHNKGEIFRAELHIVGSGLDVYASTEHEDLYTAISGVKDEMLSELRGLKGRRTSFVRRGGVKVKDMIKGIWPFA